MTQNTFNGPRATAKIEMIRDFITKHGSATAPQIAEILDIQISQVNSYLRHMAGEFMIRCDKPSVLRNGASNPAVWVIQVGPAVTCEQRRVLVGVARDVGMWREPLVAALFGEAQKQQGKYA